MVNSKGFLASRDNAIENLGDVIFKDMNADELFAIDYEQLVNNEDLNMNDFIVSNESRTTRYQIKISMEEV